MPVRFCFNAQVEWPTGVDQVKSFDRQVVDLLRVFSANRAIAAMIAKSGLSAREFVELVVRAVLMDAPLDELTSYFSAVNVSIGARENNVVNEATVVHPRFRLMV